MGPLANHIRATLTIHPINKYRLKFVSNRMSEDVTKGSLGVIILINVYASSVDKRIIF